MALVWNFLLTNVVNEPAVSLSPLPDFMTQEHDKNILVSFGPDSAFIIDKSRRTIININNNNYNNNNNNNYNNNNAVTLPHYTTQVVSIPADISAEMRTMYLVYCAMLYCYNKDAAAFQRVTPQKVREFTHFVKDKMVKRLRQSGGGGGGEANLKRQVFFLAQSCKNSLNKNAIYNNERVGPDANGFLPMSGSEPDYEPDKWNNNDADRKNHNCYAYVLDNFIAGRPKRPQPGHRNIHEKVFTAQNFTREEIARRAISDNPVIYCADPNVACQKGYYKGVLVIDRFNNYHWLRQDSDGYWSHKPGQLPVTRLDADNQLIKHPGKANLFYHGQTKEDSLLYTDVGPYFCIPSKKHTNITLEAHSCPQCGGGSGKKGGCGC